jgi:hypothetical protein
MVMMLVLGSQLLHRLFVADAGADLEAWPGRGRFPLRHAGGDSPIC